MLERDNDVKHLQTVFKSIGKLHTIIVAWFLLMYEPRQSKGKWSYVVIHTATLTL